MGFFDKIKQGLKKTTEAVTQQFEDIIASFVEVDDLGETKRGEGGFGSTGVK